MTEKNPSLREINEFGKQRLPGHLGIEITFAGVGKVVAQMLVEPFLLAPHGYLHAGSVVSLADSCAGFGCLSNLPEGAETFTTVELKSNHLGTAREGIVECEATVVHEGKTTQVWDAIVTNKETGKKIAMFRCTQMILYPS